MFHAPIYGIERETRYWILTWGIYRNNWIDFSVRFVRTQHAEVTMSCYKHQKFMHLVINRHYHLVSSTCANLYYFHDRANQNLAFPCIRMAADICIQSICRLVSVTVSTRTPNDQSESIVNCPCLVCRCTKINIRFSINEVIYSLCACKKGLVRVSI